MADFDGATAMLDALAYVKAARAAAAPAALEISQSGRGAHVWIFFTDTVPAVTARAAGTALLHEAMLLRGSMDLRSYDRLFPNQDVLPDGGFGNLIAAPLHGRRRKDGLTTFLEVSDCVLTRALRAAQSESWSGHRHPLSTKEPWPLARGGLPGWLPVSTGYRSRLRWDRRRSGWRRAECARAAPDSRCVFPAAAGEGLEDLLALRLGQHSGEGGVLPELHRFRIF